MNFNKQNEELETALKNGTAYILPPKYFLIPFFIHVIFLIALVASFLYPIFKFIDYAEKLAENCEMIYGLNSIFFKDIFYSSILLFFLLLMLTSDIGDFRKRKQPPPLIVKPYLFSERIVYRNKQNNKKEGFLAIFLERYFVLVLLFILSIFDSNIYNVKNDLIHLNIAQANENYQQKCLAKEFPFKDLRKNQP